MIVLKLLEILELFENLIRAEAVGAVVFGIGCFRFSMDNLSNNIKTTQISIQE